ncbi:hypothetical protein ACFRH4_32805 [Streptomyces mirabilis]|uniref:hypothetical protein n=1 Tax=Streptomyces mirabilis TaxID=68239 RepID=UPI0036990F3D
MLIATAGGAHLGPRLVGRIGSRTTAVGGTLIAAAGTAPLTRLSHDGSVYAGLAPGVVNTSAGESQGVDRSPGRRLSRRSAYWALPCASGWVRVLFAHWRWIGWVAGLVLAVVLVKITVFTGPARFAVRLGRASKGGCWSGCGGTGRARPRRW